MADQSRLIAEQGTAIIWGHPSGAGVTNNISVNSLASASARQGAYVDLGAQWDDEYILEAWIETGTAPTAGLAVDVYAVFATANTYWPGGTDGTDSAWPSDGNEDEWALQLGAPAVSVISSNDTNYLVKQASVVIKAKARYMTVVVDNNWDQAIRNQATAADNNTRIILTPRRLKAIDP